MKKTAFEDLLAIENPPLPDETPPDGVVVGYLVALDDDGAPLVDFPGNRAERPLVATATRHYGNADVGREVALLFAAGDTSQPLLIGPLIRPDESTPTAPAIAETSGLVEAPVLVETPGVAAAVTVDGDVTTITAERQLVLRCGAASITLTRAGKVLIRGKYLLSRSSGVNRIKGGSIQLN